MKNCKGCQRKDTCVLLKIEEKSDIQYKALCPCRNCLLKMICTEACKDYLKIIKRAFIDYDTLEHKYKRTTKIKKKTIYINIKALEKLNF
jgi:hypothetical protein